MKFLTYNPEQAYLLPPSVREVLGEDHVCFFLHRAVERLELSAFEEGYVEEGRPAYHPALLLKVWLYAYALGVTSAQLPTVTTPENLRPRTTPRRMMSVPSPPLCEITPTVPTSFGPFSAKVILPRGV